MKLLLTFILLFTLGYSLDLEKVITKMEDNLRGVNAYNKVTMIVKTSRGDRTMKVEGWSKGSKKSFMRILYPKKDRGITFLKLDNQMWQYVPKIEKTIKIPASMMMQSWMGSGFSNDDMVKESSMSDDYDKKLLNEEKNLITIELIPKEDAAVVWGKLIMVLDTNTYVPVSVAYYNEDNELERTLYYKDIRKVGKRYFPFEWLMQPETEEDREKTTKIHVDKIDFSPKLKSNLFTKQALKRYSK